MRQKNLAHLEQNKLNQAYPALAAAYRAADNSTMKKITSASLLASNEFVDFYHGADGSPERFAVADLSEEEKSLYGVQSDILWLSRKSLDEHKDRHPEVTFEDYARIPDIVLNGAVWGGHSPRRYILLMVDGQSYRAAIKSDAKGLEAWFLSLVISGKQKPPKGAVRLR